MTERLMTAAEVADFLGVSLDTVWDWHEAGELPSFKIGRAVRFRREEIDLWVESKRTPGANTPERHPDARAGTLAHDNPA
jgi:excisionase family DNA binding protein